MAAILFVRIKSKLDPEELDRRLLERRPRFRDVPGLVQKIYGRDESTGDVCGICFFEDQSALAAFRETELARTIPTAYEAKEVRREVYEVLYPLHPDEGRSQGELVLMTPHDMPVLADASATAPWLGSTAAKAEQQTVQQSRRPSQRGSSADVRVIQFT
jgi:hypothetical protein